MMTDEEREDLADELGYQAGSCPRCGCRIWSDTGRFQCVCGFDSDPGPEEESNGD